MDLNKNFYYTTIHFHHICDMPIMKSVSGDTYRNDINGELYRNRKLYDCGWGQEDGYEMLPALPFNELIQLVICFDDADGVLTRNEKFSNVLWAVSVIMQEHIGEFINFLAEKVNTDFFQSERMKQNFRHFAFDNKLSGGAGGIGRKSYEDVLSESPKWLEISSKVKQQMYE